jgi:DNA polymerase-3 subunit epsilon
VLSELLDLTRPLVLFDLETTGVDPDTARIVQYAHRVYRHDTDQIGVYATLVNPDIAIPLNAVESHGISDVTVLEGCAWCKQPKEVHPTTGCNHWRPAPRFSDIAKNLARGFANVDFAGYNVRAYDLKVITAEFRRCNITFDYSGAYILDGLHLWRYLESRTLTDAVGYFGGRSHEGAHDAYEDVVGTEAALAGQLAGRRSPEYLLRKAAELRLPRTVKELHELCFPRDLDAIDVDGKFKFINGVACFAFGKCKGQPLVSAPDYLQWMLKGTFEPDTKRVAREVLAGNLPTQSALPLQSEDAQGE